MIVIASLLNY